VQRLKNGSLSFCYLASTTKQQSLHSKQESPPPTHQLGEPPLMADGRSSRLQKKCLE